MIALNTDTRIEVLLRREQRTVRLIRGEAMFDVAHDAARPFVVDTGLAGLRVLGTAFNVRVRQQTVELTVTRGLVGVQQGNAPMRQVPASTLATIRSSAVTIASVPPVRMAQRTAWQAGKIELDGETLTEAVNEFNRYLDHPLVIGDPKLASIRLGGTFATGDANRFTAALEASFGIHAVRLNDGSTVLLRAD